MQYPIEDAVFAIEGWVPKNQIHKLRPLIEGKAVFFEPIVVEKEDRIPTCMENKDVGRIGEDLVRIYDIPAATDKDPSGWVFCAFVLFFAMIIADGGYGLIFLGLAFFLKAKFPNLKAGAKRFMQLIFILATTCIVWGILTSSFFGIDMGPKGPLAKLSILDRIAEKKAAFPMQKNDSVHKFWVKKYPAIQSAKTGQEMHSRAVAKKGKIKSYEMLRKFSNNILLEFSLFVGVVHVCLGLLRYCRRNFANLGWVAFAIGGYLYFPVSLKATSMIEFLGWIPKDTAATVGIQLIYIGMGAAVLLALFQKRLRGIGEITHVIEVFADILSYLRLYALALASSIMASTFNDIGLGIGLVVGSIIILLGHSVNLLLASMGGVIHGLRLNFIEWYHYCFEGEGKIFNPLRKLKEE